MPPKKVRARVAKMLGIQEAVFDPGGPTAEQELRRSTVMGSVGSMVKEIRNQSFSEQRYPEPSASGWMFGDASHAEQQFLTLLHNLERTVRAMVGTPDAVSTEDLRINQLAICRAAMHACEATGRPVPPFVTRIYNELIAGTFK